MFNMAKVVNIYDAKTQLSALVERAAGGEEIVLAKAGKPRAMLVPLPRKPKRRRPVNALGVTYIADDFDAPLPDDVLRTFYGGDGS
jgi:prevent-host-death family protein